MRRTAATMNVRTAALVVVSTLGSFCAAFHADSDEPRRRIVRPNAEAHFAPTVKGFGILAKLPAIRPKPEKGILFADPSGAHLIYGMPLLCLSDPALDAPLDAFFNSIPDDKLPQRKSSAGKPIVSPGTARVGLPVRYTRLELRESYKGVGCYNTCIDSVIVAALANRTPTLGLLKRTAEFDAIGPMKVLGFPDVSKPLNQLAWNHEQQFLGENAFQLNRAPPALPRLPHRILRSDRRGRGALRRVD